MAFPFVKIHEKSFDGKSSHRRRCRRRSLTNNCNLRAQRREGKNNVPPA